MDYFIATNNSRYIENLTKTILKIQIPYEHGGKMVKVICYKTSIMCVLYEHSESSVFIYAMGR